MSQIWCAFHRIAIKIYSEFRLTQYICKEKLNKIKSTEPVYMHGPDPSGSAELNNKYPMTNKNLWVSYKFLLLKPLNLHA